MELRLEGGAAGRLAEALRRGGRRARPAAAPSEAHSDARPSEGNWAALLLLMRFPWAPADAATRALPAACRQAAGSAILDALLAAGADVTSRNDGELPCVEAARGGDAETIRWLLEHGADVDEADRFANTPLAAACLYGHTRAAAEVVAAGADLHKPGNAAGWCPLAIAADAGRADCVEVLLAAGVRAGAQDRTGRSPAERAKESGHERLAQRLRALQAEEGATAMR